MTDPAPVYYINRAPIALNGCCCEIVNEIGTAEKPLGVVTVSGPVRWPSPAWKTVCAFVLAAALAVVAIGIARAAEHPTDRPWIVWDVEADKPWISKKTGLPATATGPTACSLSLHEVSKASPSGTRLACQRKN